MTMALTATARAIRAAYIAPQQPSLADQLLPLPAADVLSLEIAHIDTLHQIANGTATAQTLWDWTSNVLTWSRAADLTCMGQEEMSSQLQLCLDLIARWRRTGSVAFDGPGYQLAKHGVAVMDALAREVPVALAREAARWSEQRMAQMRTQEERIAA